MPVLRPGLAIANAGRGIHRALAQVFVTYRVKVAGREMDLPLRS